MVRKNIVNILLVLISLGCFSCIKKDSNLESFSVDKALYFYGIIGGVGGTSKQEKTLVEKLMTDTSIGLDYTTEYSAKSSLEKDKILEITKETISYLDDEASFFFYINGHGAKGGYITTGSVSDSYTKSSSKAEEYLTLDSLMSAFKEGRTKDGKLHPIKRLIIFVDTCFSGSFLDSVFEDKYKDVYKEAVVIASSNSDTETSSSASPAYFFVFDMYFLKEAQLNPKASWDDLKEKSLKRIEDLVSNLKTMSNIRKEYEECILDKFDEYKDKISISDRSNPTFNDLKELIYLWKSDFGNRNTMYLKTSSNIENTPLFR